MKANQVCCLCGEEAFLFCRADRALLCRSCDASVHSANFLVARHIRQPFCSVCKDFAGNLVSGDDLRQLRSQYCRSCSPLNVSGGDHVEDDDSSLSSSVSSVCVSSSESKIRFEDRPKLMERIGSSDSVTDLSGSVEETSVPVKLGGEVSSANKTKRDSLRPRGKGLTSVDAKAEGIFEKWCRDMALGGNFAVVGLASEALGFCVARSRLLPFRVSLAASFWYGMRSCENKSAARTLHSLRRLQRLSGVPVKLIVAVELQLSRELKAQKHRRRDDLKEGWAECSG
ncbi:B-box zinc finger protein 32-like [Humulus lupulus]|uniref:B-box zinc finger protein 32-like n=1 Tax=Humulus lupulus TaxID=3486 RepID=UPI002B4128A1|nr:B-box zinc finger protein 32-like [Humulus lupulus]